MLILNFKFKFHVKSYLKNVNKQSVTNINIKWKHNVGGDEEWGHRQVSVPYVWGNGSIGLKECFLRRKKYLHERTWHKVQQG